MLKNSLLRYQKRYEKAKSFSINWSNVGKNDEIILGCIDIPVTTRCTLRCKECSSLITYYQQSADLDMDQLLLDLDHLLERVDYLERVNVLGGEPFLHPELYRLLAVLNQSPKINKIRIISNGTVTDRNPLLLEQLKMSKIQVRISHYTACDKPMKQFVEFLQANGVAVTIKQFGAAEFKWYHFGGFHARNRSLEALNDQKQRCDVEWFSLLHGNLFCCPRAAHATDLGLIPKDEENCFCLEQSRESLARFILREDAFPACQYCDRGTDACYEVKVAVQNRDENHD